MAHEQINIGVIGFGTVGVGAVELLETNADWIAQRVGSRVVVKTVVDVDWSRPRAYALRPDQQSTDADALLLTRRLISSSKRLGEFDLRVSWSPPRCVTASRS